MMITLASGFSVSSQINATRNRWVQLFSDTLTVDSLSIFPGSLRIYCQHELLDPSYYDYNWLSSHITICKTLSCDSLLLTYRVIPSRVATSYYNKPLSLITPGSINFLEPHKIVNDMDDSWMGSQIESNGSISRGIQIGNAQSVTVNSSLNLQLGGKLSERFSVAGMVSDNNIPIQPGGATRQVEDIDRVFIQVYDKNNRLTAGDFQLNRPYGYFLNYFKRGQGALFQRGEAAGEKNYLEISGAISKGRFGRNVIQGIEGNQGPYRLNGAEGETFIIVLAGTEQVYIDGRLLTRGQDADYTIDYNSAEIRFTPKQFITKDRRIVVEFQYSDKRYARPLVTTSLFRGTKENHVYLNIFSEHDAKNQSLQQELTESDKQILRRSGDNPIGAYRSGIDFREFDYNQVMYELRDSLGFDSVLVYSNDTGKANATAVFTFVGSGQGDYIEDGFIPAGKKYRWISPTIIGLDTIHNGSYLPIYVLYAPAQQQMITGGGRWKINDFIAIAAEGAVTHKDKNSFSSIDNSDNVGSAIQAKLHLGRDVAGAPVSIFTEGSFEYLNRRFSQVERFREVEFSRNWNLPSNSMNHDQIWARLQPGVRFKKTGVIQLGADVLEVRNMQQGRKYSGLVKLQRKDNWQIDGNGSVLSVIGEERSEFIRHKSNWSKTIRELSIRFSDEHEWNRKYESLNITLLPEAYRFYDWETSIGTVDTTIKAIRFNYRERYEQRSDTNQLVPASIAQQYGVQSRYQWQNGNHIGINIGERKLQIIRSDLLNTPADNTLVGRFDNSLRLLNGGIVASSFYEIGSGLEQRRSFFYSEVSPGQGTHVWVDYNADGIRDLNEFEVAPFDYEANYIRVSAPSNDYIKIFNNTFNQSLQLNLSRIIKSNKTVGKFIGRWSDAAMWRQERKTGSVDDRARLDPFFDWRSDTALMVVTALLRNVIFFNRSGSVFAMDHTFQENTRRELLSQGINVTSEKTQAIQARITLFGELTIFNTFSLSSKKQFSDLIPNRSYDFVAEQMEPRIVWQRSAEKSIELRGRYVLKSEVSGLTSSLIRGVGVNSSINILDKSSFSASVDYILIRYKGEVNSPLAFDMLEGLNNGENITWNISWQQSVAKNLQMNLSYQGRDSRDTRPIHVGSIQLRAVF